MMYRRILFLLLVILPAGLIVAQQNLSVAPIVSTLSTSTGNFYYASRNEPPRAIEFKDQTVTTSYFLTNINNYFAIPIEFTFIEAESNADDLGMRHRLLQQYYKGIRLEGTGYRVHEKDGFIRSANGKSVRDVNNVDTQTTLSEEQAFNLAKQYLNTKDTTTRHGEKLIVSKGFTFAPGSFSVAYQFDIDVSLIEQWRISIDARNGQLLNKVSLVNSCGKEKELPIPYSSGTGMTNYYGAKTIRIEKLGSGSRLVGQTENGGIIGTYDFRNVSVISLLLFFEFSKAYDFYSSDDTYNSSYLKPAVSVQWAAEQAYEYYFKKHNRNSYDNKGSAIKSYVHVDQNMNNAFWTHNLLAFGDGSNNNPLVELDVVAHELTHGVTQYEASLSYYYESGALNESFSDIFGKAVEFSVLGAAATWQVGKNYQVGGLRNMSNPNLKNQPDTYNGNLWYTGAEDNGGVHYNSGVQNFWFYLLCEGGSGINDNDVNYSVNAIGIDKATNITYRNLTEYLSPYSDYLDSRIGSLLATSDLYGNNSTVYQEVDKAWDAVGVIDEPIITNLELYDITATTVKIKGGMLPRGDIASYHFEYGTTPAFGSSSPVYPYTSTVEGMLTGLQSSTKYYLKLVATNENGSSYTVTNFTTISLAPLVKIKQTVDVTETTATLYGQVNPNSLSTSFYFEYGLTPALGLVTSSYPMPGTTEFQDIAAPVINLQPRKTYYYRVVATNSFTSTTSESVSFFTANRPVILSYTPATAPIGTEVTITGQNFNLISQKNLVSFGATRATVLSSSSTELKVKVPAGASLGVISILDAESGLTAESTQEFVPTFTGEFKKNSLQLRVGLNEPYIYNILVQDMDGDNRPDIVSVHYQGFSVFQNVNQGGDITSESFIRSTYPIITNYNSGELHVVDLDGNGLKDVVLRYQNGVRMYPNLSVPGFIFFAPPVDLSMEYLSNLTFNDFDNDGRIDMAGTRSIAYEKSMVTILRNQNPKGSLLANNFVQQYTLTLPYSVEYLTMDDLNNDGTQDLMAGSDYKKFLSVLTNNSQPGTFEFEENLIPDLNRGERYIKYVSHDLNQDGWKDIISHSPEIISNMSIMENKGTSPGTTVTTPNVTLGQYGSGIQVGDINGDGKVDMLVALRNSKFTFFENKISTGGHITNFSFEKFQDYGTAAANSSSNTVQTRILVNDLNGDGRPEIINTNSYNYSPRDGFLMEIWQNSPNNCLDPSLIKLTASRSSATLVLPPNTSLDQFEIEYAILGYSTWNKIYSTLFNIQSGYTYQLRARSKCYLGFSDYYYINFSTCVDISTFSINNIDINKVSLSPSDLSSFEIQYSPAGKDQWTTLYQYATQILNLLPGTTYDVRLRGRCSILSDFTYKQFTTLCPKLSTLTISDIIHNRAMANWKSSYTGNAVLEYSVDNVTWTLVDQTQIMYPLSIGKQYFVRGRMVCKDINSDFIYTSFTTPCPKISTLDFDAVTPFSARINWVDKSNTNSYILNYSITAGGVVRTVQTNLTSFTLRDLNPGTFYKVAVAPQCIASKEFTETIFSTLCYVPFSLSAKTITHTTAELSWNDNFSGSPYFIDYSILESNVWQTLETTSTSIVLAELRPGTKYEARVHINCQSQKAPHVSLRFETDLYEKTRFAPNPTPSEITIYPSQNLIGNSFSIHDSAGRILAHGKLLDYTIDLSDFSAGIYTLKIDGEKPMKIIKRY